MPTIDIVSNFLLHLQQKGIVTGMRTRIKEFRARLDMTQEDLAKRVGVRRETIVFLEKGKYNPSLLLAHRVAKALKTTIEEVFVFEKGE